MTFSCFWNPSLPHPSSLKSNIYLSVISYSQIFSLGTSSSSFVLLNQTNQQFHLQTIVFLLKLRLFEAWNRKRLKKDSDEGEKTFSEKVRLVIKWLPSLQVNHRWTSYSYWWDATLTWDECPDTWPRKGMQHSIRVLRTKDQQKEDPVLEAWFSEKEDTTTMRRSNSQKDIMNKQVSWGSLLLSYRQ